MLPEGATFEFSCLAATCRAGLVVMSEAREAGREVGVGEGKGPTSFTIFASNRTVSTESQDKGPGKGKSKWGLVRSAVATGRIKVS